MNLRNQIRDLRKAKGLSQEDLAERIYVSRQTISNWETGRSYPDVQNLLMLSTLFEVSLDELVKGDLDMMKKAVDASRMGAWSWVMVTAFVVGGLVLMPIYDALGTVGLFIPGGLIIVGIIAGAVLEVLKKRNQVKTYSEILAFVANESLDEDKAQKERKRYILSKILMMAVSAIIMAAVVFAGGFIWSVLG